MKSGGGSMVEIWVEDSGPGIPHAKAESLFEKFTQLHGHDKGTGIGLSLCREIVDGMGGTIRVDTTYTSGSAAFGPGSRFVVEIPLLPAEEEEKEKEAEEAPSSPSSLPSPVPLSPQHSADDDDEALLRRTASWRVLAVDDVEMVRKLLVRTLKAALGAGCVVVEAASSREALAAIKASSAREDNPFDLIVLDEHMDSNDDSEQQLTSGGENSRSGGSVDVFGPKGTDLARHLRAKGSTAVIAGFSGDDMEAEHKAAGCDLSWRKTVTASSMRAGLLECLRKGIRE
jgi:CheY-like chemotaxis protein